MVLCHLPLHLPGRASGKPDRRDHGVRLRGFEKEASLVSLEGVWAVGPREMCVHVNHVNPESSPSAAPLSKVTVILGGWIIWNSVLKEENLMLRINRANDAFFFPEEKLTLHFKEFFCQPTVWCAVHNSILLAFLLQIDFGGIIWPVMWKPCLPLVGHVAAAHTVMPRSRWAGRLWPARPGRGSMWGPSQQPASLGTEMPTVWLFRAS